MATEPTIFVFANAEIRVVMLDDAPHFVGKDVAERLGYSNAADAISKHCKGVAKRYPLSTEGGMQEVRVLSEPDVLRLIVRSKLPEAQQFEQWVFEEVLPSIRKCGGYMVAAPDETPEELAARALIVMQATIERQKAQLAAAQPTLESHERLVNAKGRTNLREVGKELKIGSQKGIELMRQVGWIFKDARGKWKAYASAVDAGYVEMKYATFTNTAGEEVATQTVYVTPRGVTRLDARLAQH
ncbi:phage antirepressor KilAC domain-containing protein [Asaia bogorensis]|uniref:Bro-N domain-containing protein n=1 Tax=Asaia bogorensis NBRC 16594 TaxID=1231624 RepID=A0AAN4R4N3_9PROT|nr:phage antirepressor [Asaia bogorensis]BAT19793.1 phage associated-antirepressor BRO [Asaia bogorensis NBRC 16594]GBQ77687.1 prophage antirepressor [Asaia bogorensis NBRC 16594]GEL54367.1 hypothetical protein ABO01nite_23740 [Asaia bogorensis NBRC 16594]